MLFGRFEPVHILRQDDFDRPDVDQFLLVHGGMGGARFMKAFEVARRALLNMMIMLPDRPKCSAVRP
jgi:hypothetical protein